MMDNYTEAIRLINNIRDILDLDIHFNYKQILIKDLIDKWRDYKVSEKQGEGDLK